jgi:hypothetical protein
MEIRLCEQESVGGEQWKAVITDLYSRSLEMKKGIGRLETKDNFTK